MRRKRFWVLLCLAVLVPLAGCDLATPNSHHSKYGGYQGCNASSTHQVYEETHYLSFTTEDLAHPCVSVGARVWGRGFDGYYYVSGWDFDTVAAQKGNTFVSSDWADHELCKGSTNCAMGRS